MIFSISNQIPDTEIITLRNQRCITFYVIIQVYKNHFWHKLRIKMHQIPKRKLVWHFFFILSILLKKIETISERIPFFHPSFQTRCISISNITTLINPQEKQHNSLNFPPHMYFISITKQHESATKPLFYRHWSFSSDFYIGPWQTRAVNSGLFGGESAIKGIRKSISTPFNPAFIHRVRT